MLLNSPTQQELPQPEANNLRPPSPTPLYNPFGRLDLCSLKDPALDPPRLGNPLLENEIAPPDLGDDEFKDAGIRPDTTDFAEGRPETLDPPDFDLAMVLPFSSCIPTPKEVLASTSSPPPSSGFEVHSSKSRRKHKQVHLSKDNQTKRSSHGLSKTKVTNVYGPFWNCKGAINHLTC